MIDAGTYFETIAISNDEVVQLVKAAKDYGKITDAEFTQLRKAMDWLTFEPGGREALGRYLEAHAPASLQETWDRPS